MWFIKKKNLTETQTRKSETLCVSQNFRPQKCVRVYRELSLKQCYRQNLEREEKN